MNFYLLDFPVRLKCFRVMKSKLIIFIAFIALQFTCLGCGDSLKPDSLGKYLPESSETNSGEGKLTEISFDEYSIIFGFSDTNGRDILAISDTLPDPKLYTKAISAEGKLIPVSFIQQKKAVEGKDAQQTYNNFSNCGGYLFRCSNGNVNYKNVAVLMTEKFLSERKLITNILPETKKLDANALNKIESIKQRKIKNSFPLVKVDGYGSLYLVNFVVVNDTAMFSLVLMKGNRLLFKDNIADYDPAGTWRVGDAGLVKPNAFQVLAAFTSKYGIEFALNWIGAEGDYIEYLIENGNTLQAGKNEYRYTAAF